MVATLVTLYITCQNNFLVLNAERSLSVDADAQLLTWHEMREY